MVDSTQHKLDRVKPPRVQITYDVEIGNAIVTRELSYVIGILTSLSGHNQAGLPPLKNRKFVEIDRDNFDDVMAAINPQLEYKIPNVIDKSSEEIKIQLSFKQFSDLDPLAILLQIPQLASLYRDRSVLGDLATKLDGNEKLDTLLTAVINSPDLQKQLRSQIQSFKQNTQKPIT